jgi:prepilin-type N-terminal cleavage/methylation domain-containing protein
MRITRQSRSPAFTLVELLAAIAIVAVLLAILLPTLAGTWASARLNVHRSNMRECLNSISMYSENFRSHFPFMGVVGRPELGVGEFNDLEPPGSGLPYNAEYFPAHSFHWPTAVVRAGFPLQQIADPDLERRESVLDRYGNTEVLGSAYQLTHAAVAAPHYWLPGPVPEPTASIFKPMRTDQLRFPSSKGLLVAMRLGVYDNTDDKEQTWILVGMGDNSVSKRENPAFANIGPRPYAALDLPVLTTEGGFEGRDF